MSGDGNTYDEGLINDFWKPIKAYWKEPESRETWDTLRSFLAYEATKWQYTHSLKYPELVERIAGLVVEFEDPAQQGMENGRAGIEADGRRECADRLVLATQVPQIECEVEAAGDPRGGRGRRPADNARSPRPIGWSG